MENNKQVTAVEWLVSELNQKIDFIPMDKWDMIRDIIQQAKALEKQQIENAYWDGGEDMPMISKQCEQYYNEKFEA
jgi:hypothetical protein